MIVHVGGGAGGAFTAFGAATGADRHLRGAGLAGNDDALVAPHPAAGADHSRPHARRACPRALGEGYSAIAGDGATLVTMYRPIKGLVTILKERVWSPATAPEAVIALDAASGRTLWEHAYDAPTLPRMNVEYGTGPHATPLIVGDKVYAVGSTGRMHALDLKTGRVVWAHDLYGELKGTVQGRDTRAARWRTAAT